MLCPTAGVQHKGPPNGTRMQRSLLFTALTQLWRGRRNCTVCHHLAALLNDGVPHGNAFRKLPESSRRTVRAFGGRPATLRNCPVGPTCKTRLEDVVLEMGGASSALYFPISPPPVFCWRQSSDFQSFSHHIFTGSVALSIPEWCHSRQTHFWLMVLSRNVSLLYHLESKIDSHYFSLYKPGWM